MNPTLAACQTALRTHPAALLVDLDGTISEIVEHPELAVVRAGCREALRALAGRIALVGVLSGRPALEAKGLVGLDMIDYWGLHGMDFLKDGVASRSREAQLFEGAVTAAGHELGSWDFGPGARLEKKGLSVAVHYRGVADPVAWRLRFLSYLEKVAATQGLEVLEGRKVIELRPPGFGKGWCVTTIIQEWRLGAVVYVGDDRTDSEVFQALREWRHTSGARSVSVGVSNPEVAGAWASPPDFAVADVDAVEQLLQDLAVAL